MNILKRSLHTVGSGPVEKAVIKATYGGDADVPKEKHVQVLYGLRHDEFSLAASLLRERTHSKEWIVVLKSLNVVHLMLSNLYANDFAQSCSSMQQRGSSFSVDMFFDPRAVEQSQFVKNYSGYMARKIQAYGILGVLIENHKAKEGSLWLGTLPVHTLCKVLPEAQSMLDMLFQCVPRTAYTSEVPVIRSCLRLLLTDGFRLYSLINSHVLAVTKKYQDMSSEELKGTIDGMRKFQEQYQAFKRWYEVMGRLGVATGNVDIGECTVPDQFVALLEKRLGEVGNLQRLDLSGDLKDFKLTVKEKSKPAKKKKKKKRASSAQVVAPTETSMQPSQQHTGNEYDPFSSFDAKQTVVAEANPFDPFAASTTTASMSTNSQQPHHVQQSNNFDPFSFPSSSSSSSSSSVHTSSVPQSSSSTNNVMDDFFFSDAPVEQKQRGSGAFVDHFANLSTSVSAKQQQQRRTMGMAPQQQMQPQSASTMMYGQQPQQQAQQRPSADPFADIFS